MTTETIHLRKPYARSVACGITGPVRITERLSETTCARCQYEGDPVPRTRAIQVERAHAEALAVATTTPARSPNSERMPAMPTRPPPLGRPPALRSASPDSNRSGSV